MSEIMNQEVIDKLNEYFSENAVKTYSKGQVIIHADEDPKGVLLLIDGMVEQYDITPEGNRITVNIFKPTAFFPMSWAVNKTPNSYFYAALSDVKLRRADANKTVDFLRANPDVLFDLLSRVYKGTDALLQRLVVTASGIAASRLIFELLIEAYRFGKEIDDSTWLVTTKQFSLAERSGLARETVNRELHKLEKENLISMNNKDILIKVNQLENKLNS
jgi:CRP-like cAMP-binding protein